MEIGRVGLLPTLIAFTFVIAFSDAVKQREGRHHEIEINMYYLHWNETDKKDDKDTKDDR